MSSPEVHLPCCVVMKHVVEAVWTRCRKKHELVYILLDQRRRRYSQTIQLDGKSLQPSINWALCFLCSKKSSCCHESLLCRETSTARVSIQNVKGHFSSHWRIHWMEEWLQIVNSMKQQILQWRYHFRLIVFGVHKLVDGFTLSWELSLQHVLNNCNVEFKLITAGSLTGFITCFFINALSLRLIDSLSFGH